MNYDVNAYTGNHTKEYIASCQKERDQYRLIKQAQQHREKSQQSVQQPSTIISLLTAIFTR